MANNEKTSARIAREAAKVMNHADLEIESLNAAFFQMEIAVNNAVAVLKQAKKVAASALAQAPDKKKKRA